MITPPTAHILNENYFQIKMVIHILSSFIRCSHNISEIIKNKTKVY